MLVILNQPFHILQPLNMASLEGTYDMIITITCSLPNYKGVHYLATRLCTLIRVTVMNHLMC
jgi:hypothetical protein